MTAERMTRRERDCWKHWTANDGQDRYADPVGVDLFDDEYAPPETGPQTVIYLRLANGRRYGARTVNMTEPKHVEKVLGSWAKRGPVRDYRTRWHGIGATGEDKRPPTISTPLAKAPEQED